MTVPRHKKASKSSDAPSRKLSRSAANASDASDQINGIFGAVGSRTRSRSTSASAHTMKTALNQQLDKIAIKKETNAKQEASVMNMSRTEQKQPEGSARVPRVKQIASSVNNAVAAYTSFALTNQCHRGTGTVPDVSSISTGRLRTTTKTGSNRINCATS